DRTFWEMYEHRAPTPISRLLDLKKAHERGQYTWVSIEPCLCTGIWTQDIRTLLNSLNFVDLMVLGMWNYDPRSRTDEARKDYRRTIATFKDFCKEHGIRHHIKSETLDFIEAEG
ncbi:unnamed protein product, partial [marine sediment metagenome]